jgi:hypothetical protein
MEAFRSVAGTQWHFLDTETRESWCGIPPGSLSLENGRPWDETPPQYLDVVVERFSRIFGGNG